MAKEFCKHYHGMYEKTKCAADVEFATLDGYGVKGFYDTCPCFGPEQTGKCEHKVYPSPEEMAADEARMAIRFGNISKARGAIVEHCGGPWKRGDGSKQGAIDCPVCEGEGALQFSRAGYNGHVHATCKTEGCVSWME